MTSTSAPEADTGSVSEACIPEERFLEMRRENLARWPTGKEADLDEAVALQKGLPPHKRLAAAMRRAVREGVCLIQPRGGFGTIALQKELMVTLDREGLADIVPTTTDSYTRNERFAQAQAGMEESQAQGRSMLNGFPIVNFGARAARELTAAIEKPAILLSGTAMPRLTSEMAFAAGFSGYLGSALAYTVSYTKELTIEEGIRNYQYLDRLTALYLAHGVELHRRQPGFLTGTNIPPSIAIAVAVLDLLLAVAQGVKNYGLELAQTLHMVQDAASVQVCGELCQEYLGKKGYVDIFTPVTSLHWMGAWPQDESQATALIVYGGVLAAVSGAASVTTKTTHEAFGIPTPGVNAEGLRMTRMGSYLGRNVRLDGLPELEREKELIRREVRAIVDKVLEMGEGDAAAGAVRAFQAGVLDIPWSPNRQVRGRVLPARDVDGCLRIYDPGAMPYPKDILEFHRERLQRRAEKEGVPCDEQLVVTSVYEISEQLENLIPSGWQGLAGRRP